MPATSKPGRVGLYFRGAGPELTRLRQFAREQFPGAEIAEYVDPANTPGRQLEAPRFLALWKDIASGSIQHVVSREAGRWALDFVDATNFVRLLDEKQVDVATPDEKPGHVQEQLQRFWGLFRRGGQPGNQHARKWTEEQAAQARRLRDRGKLTMEEIAAEVGLSRATVYRILRKTGDESED